LIISRGKKPVIDYTKVASVYDTYVTTAFDVSFFIQEARGCESVLELTSGTGRLSIPLIEAGVKLTCLDRSREMLSVLRRKLAARDLETPVYQLDMCNFELSERFDLILIPFNSFSEIADPKSQAMALQAIRRHLLDRGRFICTLYNPSVRLKLVDGQSHERGKFPLPDGRWLTLASVERYDVATQLIEGEQCFEINSEDGRARETWNLDIRFCLHSRESFEKLAVKAGFRVLHLYGNYQRAAFEPERSPFMIWEMDSGVRENKASDFSKVLKCSPK
jgi:SAM-dependent methyltransferase